MRLDPHLPVPGAVRGCLRSGASAAQESPSQSPRVRKAESCEGTPTEVYPSPRTRPRLACAHTSYTTQLRTGAARFTFGEAARGRKPGTSAQANEMLVAAGALLMSSTAIDDRRPSRPESGLYHALVRGTEQRASVRPGVAPQPHAGSSTVSSLSRKTEPEKPA